MKQELIATSGLMVSPSSAMELVPTLLIQSSFLLFLGVRDRRRFLTCMYILLFIILFLCYSFWNLQGIYSMLVFTGGFYFTGRVQTINGENYIRNSRAITVKEDLSEFMEIEDEPGEDAVSLYGSLFENGGQFD